MRDDELSRLADEVAAEKRAQLEGATAVLEPLAFVADLVAVGWYGLRLLVDVILSRGRAAEALAWTKAVCFCCLLWVGHGKRAYMRLPTSVIIIGLSSIAFVLISSWPSWWKNQMLERSEGASIIG
jgi:hypothetical protein